MPSLSTTLTTIFALSSAFLPLSPLVAAAPSPAAAAASAAIDHPHGFHAPPYLASSLANAASKRSAAGNGANHVKKGLAKKFRSQAGPADNKRMEARAGERGLKRMDVEPHGSLVARDGYYGDAHGFSKPAAINRKRGTTQIPTGWSYTGCVSESDNVRLLADGFAYTASQTMSPLQCLTICEGFGYTYAGMEYADECYCANALSGDGGVIQSDSDCSMACTGDTSVMCGAAWRLSLYTYNSADSVACETVTANTTTAFASNYSVTLSTSGSTGYSDSDNTSNTSSRVNSTSSAVASIISTNTSATTLSASASATHNVSATAAPVSASGRSSSVSASSTSTAANSTITIAANSSDTSEWYSLGCAVDDSYDTARTLSYTLSLDDTSITIDECLSECEALGYTYAGLENGNQCFCDSSLPSTISYVEDSECAIACTGDASETCGGEYRMEVYELYKTYEDCTSTSTTGSVATSTSVSGVAAMLATGGSTSVLASSTAHASSASTKQEATSTTSTTAAAATSTIPASSATHAVFSHHMLGYTYGYDEAHWAYDISQAQSAGIDAFALNMGSDSWQQARATDAYTAAAAAGFKLFISLDMSSLSCGSSSDLSSLISIIKAHSTSSAQATYEGRPIVSTFSGESCYFGKSSVSAGWQAFVTGLQNDGVDLYFIPSLFSDISTFSSNDWMDGEFNWNGGWSMSSSDLTTSGDIEYIDALDGKLYMAAVSPSFFTHFGASSWNKNWIYRGDNWLYVTRWEQMISLRDKINLVEVISWNDVSESTAIGPTDWVASDLPTGSSVWTDDFPHQAWLPVTAYYGTAFKTGSYPTINTDSITMWARPHPAAATASDDDVGRPTNYQYTDDNLYALILATSAGTLTMYAGSTSQTFSIVAGANKVKMPSAAGSMSATLTRNGATAASYDAGSAYTYTESPVTYNFNYFVGSSGSWA